MASRVERWAFTSSTYCWTASSWAVAAAARCRNVSRDVIPSEASAAIAQAACNGWRDAVLHVESATTRASTSSGAR